MIDVYTECSRCGESIEGDRSREDSLIFESVHFRQVFTSGNVCGLIEREGAEDQNAFRKDYPLCPDCLKDTLEFVRGEFDPRRGL